LILGNGHHRDRKGSLSDELPNCAKGNQSTAIFCAYCGKRLDVSAITQRSAPADRKPTLTSKSKAAIFVTLFIFALFIVALLVSSNRGPANAGIPSVPSDAESKMGPEIDIPKLGFASRSQVISMIGRRLGVAPNGGDRYSSGTLEYRNGRVIALDYHSQQRPTSIDSALSKVGLVKASEPIRRESSNYQWAAPFAHPWFVVGFALRMSSSPEISPT
jgi:hypothetical protein